jgi:Phospholipase_D-nuclease N-terminal
MYLFQNALAMDPQNVSTLVLIMAAAAWVGTLIVLLVDLLTDEKRAIIWKILWFPVLVCVPVVGGFLYGSVSLIRTLLVSQQKS